MFGTYTKTMTPRSTERTASPSMMANSLGIVPLLGAVQSKPSSKESTRRPWTTIRVCLGWRGLHLRYGSLLMRDSRTVFSAAQQQTFRDWQPFLCADLNKVFRVQYLQVMRKETRDSAVRSEKSISQKHKIIEETPRWHARIAVHSSLRKHQIRRLKKYLIRS